MTPVPGSEDEGGDERVEEARGEHELQRPRGQYRHPRQQSKYRIVTSTITPVK